VFSWPGRDSERAGLTGLALDSSIGIIRRLIMSARLFRLLADPLGESRGLSRQLIEAAGRLRTQRAKLTAAAAARASALSAPISFVSALGA